MMEMNQPIGPGVDGLASVIVTVYNQEAFLAEALDSVIAQTYRPIECVVIDDGSTDGTSKVVARYGGDRQGVNFRHICQQNQGAQAARNRGVAECRGAYIQYLDGDDLLNKEKLESQIAFLSSQAGSGCDVAYGDANFLIPANGGYQSAEEIGIGPSDNFLVSLLTKRFNPNFSYLCRRAAVQRNGAWDPDIAINQDYEYFLRMACRGLRFDHVPGKTGLYRKHYQTRISDQGMILRGRTTLAILRSAEGRAEAAELLTPARRHAFAASYRNVSCWMYSIDRHVWRSSLQDALRVCPDFKPEGAVRRTLQSVFGVWATETVLGTARHLKARLNGQFTPKSSGPI